MKVLFGTIIGVLALSCLPVSAQAVGLYDVSIGAEDLTFVPGVPLVEQNNKIYLTIQNDGSRDVEGDVSFFDGEALIGTKPFSVRASARPEEVWINWRPTVLGQHRLRVSVDNETSFTDARPENNQITLSVLVDRDSDGDSVPDSQDHDRDNDGLLNTDEQVAGTNPDRRDTDGDGVDDRRDVYPLDARRSVREVPRPVTPTTTRTITPPPPRPTTPTSVVRSTTVASSSTAISSSTLPVVETMGVSSSTPTTTSSFSTQGLSATDTVVLSESVSSTVQEASPISRILVVAAVVTGMLAAGFVWLSYRRD